VRIGFSDYKLLIHASTDNPFLLYYVSILLFIDLGTLARESFYSLYSYVTLARTKENRNDLIALTDFVPFSFLAVQRVQFIRRYKCTPGLESR
jgi:hypothetical protein